MGCHALSVEASLKALHTQKNGLSQTDAENHQIKFGSNALPETNQRTLLERVIGHHSDALLILSVVIVNAVIPRIGQQNKMHNALIL